MRLIAALLAAGTILTINPTYTYTAFFCTEHRNQNAGDEKSAKQQVAEDAKDYKKRSIRC